MEDMFRARDKTIRIELSRTISKMISGSFNVETRWFRNQLECIDFAMGVDQKGAKFDLHL
jgi:hypothetical protein